MADELKYGDQINLQNGYNGWQGGYLDTINPSTATGAKYGVETATTPARGAGTGTWRILSASGKAAGQYVVKRRPERPAEPLRLVMVATSTPTATPPPASRRSAPGMPRPPPRP